MFVCLDRTRQWKAKARIKKLYISELQGKNRENNRKIMNWFTSGSSLRRTTAEEACSCWLELVPLWDLLFSLTLLYSKGRVAWVGNGNWKLEHKWLLPTPIFRPVWWDLVPELSLNQWPPGSLFNSSQDPTLSIQQRREASLFCMAGLKPAPAAELPLYSHLREDKESKFPSEKARLLKMAACISTQMIDIVQNKECRRTFMSYPNFILLCGLGHFCRIPGTVAGLGESNLRLLMLLCCRCCNPVCCRCCRGMCRL